MKLSPIQLQYYVFTRLSLEPKDPIDLDLPAKEEHLFNWSGVNLVSATEFGWGNNSGEEGKPFAVKLKLKVDNKEGQPSDYLFDVEAVGYFVLQFNTKSDIEAHDIAHTNGAALLYGAIRDQLFTLSTRFPGGPLILPTVHFLDLRKGKYPAPAAQALPDASAESNKLPS
jgi:preprotein translocase subunit SecB